MKVDKMQFEGTKPVPFLNTLTVLTMFFIVYHIYAQNLANFDIVHPFQYNLDESNRSFCFQGNAYLCCSCHISYYSLVLKKLKYFGTPCMYITISWTPSFRCFKIIMHRLNFHIFIFKKIWLLSLLNIDDL